jgi:hypothetical protein
MQPGYSENALLHVSIVGDATNLNTKKRCNEARPSITLGCQLQRVPLEVNRRVGKGALCAPCPPLATDRVDGVPKKCAAFFGDPGTARAVKLACRSNDRSARLCPPYKRDPVSSGPAVAREKMRKRLEGCAGVWNEGK